MLECFQRGSRWCNPSIITTWHKRHPDQWDPGSSRKACLSALSLQDRYLLTQGIEMVVVTKKQAKSQQLPLTQAALHQARVLHVHDQLLVWNNNIVSNPVLSSPEGSGWKWKEDEKAWIPVMTTLPQNLRQSSTSWNVNAWRRGVRTIIASAGRLDWRAEISVTVVRTLAKIARTSRSMSTMMTVMMKMMMLMMTRASVNTFQILMANSTKISLSDNFLSTLLNKRL